MTIAVADLCHGMGSFTEAAHHLGMQTTWAADISPHAHLFYQRRYPDVPLHGDLATIDHTTLPMTNIITAGCPCQPFSSMGNREGFLDERGHVIRHVIDIVEATKPRAVILEQVPGILTHNGGLTFATILDALAITGVGYRLSWRKLTATDYGLPQKRTRVFTVALRHDVRCDIDWPAPRPQDTPSLEAILGHPFVKQHSRTIRTAAWHEPSSSHRGHAKLALRDGTDHQLTPEEGARLQGFVDPDFTGICTTEARRLVGNSIPVCLTEAVLRAVKDSLEGRGAPPSL
jgi:DNA (cytosine-5)-methyltransferase 1